MKSKPQCLLFRPDRSGTLLVAGVATESESATLVADLPALTRDTLPPMSGEAKSGPLPANASGAIYGQILVTSLVAALSEDSDIDAEYILISVTATMLVFWLAHVYAEAVSRGLEARRHVSWAEIRRLAAGEWPMVQAAFPTAIVLALGAVGAFSTETTIDIAIAVGVAALIAWGLAIGRASGSSWTAPLFGAAISAGFGLAIVGLKALVH
jgi:hypothetical protein